MKSTKLLPAILVLLSLLTANDPGKIYAAPEVIQPVSAEALPAAPVRQIGNLYIRKYGSGKQALILVPGLACGAWVWDQTVRDFQSDYTIYTVTLAGFDGTKPPADQDTLLDQDVAGLSKLISTDNIIKPIIVGHSLGGHLALRLAAQQSDTLKGVVIVDSLPLFPPLQPGETMDQRKQSGPTVIQQMMQSSDAAFAAQERQTCAYFVTDPKQADFVADKSLTSDRNTVAHAIAQMMTTDLSSQLPQITVPVLVLTPSPSAGSSDYIQTTYTKAYTGTPHVRVQVITPSRHFIMLDQPAQFESALHRFLADPNATLTTP